MKYNINDLGAKVRDVCNTLDKAGGANNASEEDWEVFKNSIDAHMDKAKAYMKELDEQLKNDIASFVNKNDN